MDKKYRVTITYEIEVDARDEELAEEEALSQIGHVEPSTDIEEIYIQ